MRDKLIALMLVIVSLALSSCATKVDAQAKGWWRITVGHWHTQEQAEAWAEENLPDNMAWEAMLFFDPDFKPRVLLPVIIR